MLTLAEAIDARHSVRTFSAETPGKELLPPTGPARPHIFPVSPDDLAGSKIGTYGVIKGSPAYVAVVCAPKDNADALAAGMEGESYVLECVRRGLGTCWLGGTFDRRKVLLSLGGQLPAGKEVCAVIAVGIPAAKRSVVERVMRHMSKADKRKPLSQLVIAGDVPARAEAGLRALQLAPSALNRQPWRLAFNGDGSVDVYGDPSDSFMALDTGIALCHFLALAPDYRPGPPRHSHPTLIPLASLSMHL